MADTQAFMNAYHRTLTSGGTMYMVDAPSLNEVTMEFVIEKLGEQCRHTIEKAQWEAIKAGSNVIYTSYEFEDWFPEDVLAEEEMQAIWDEFPVPIRVNDRSIVAEVATLNAEWIARIEAAVTEPVTKALADWVYGTS